MGIWIVEPHDPLIFRDGRPFGPTPGARAHSLPFPFPSTVAGSVRGKAGMDQEGVFLFANDQDTLDDLKKLNIRGPFLIELDHSKQDTYRLLLPAPHDALLFQSEKQDRADNKMGQQFKIEPLVPLDIPSRAQSDFAASPLLPVGLPASGGGKAATGPLYWHWDFFLQWLCNPAALTTQEEKIGHNGPVRELRVHIAMDSTRGTALDEALFDTSGMEFTSGKPELLVEERKRLALAVVVDENERLQQKAIALHAGFGNLGGEHRIVVWRQSSHDLPACPETLVNEILRTRHCRIILLTPAYFEQGYHPTWLCQKHQESGVTPRLKALIVQRPDVVSGWDIKARRPKSSRRLAPAGTVLYLSLEDGSSEDALCHWIQSLWLHSISDLQPDPTHPEQYRHDGFGIAAIGTWSGEPVSMKGQAK